LGILFIVSACGVITKPFKIATDLTMKPVKIVTDATIDVLEKPAKKAFRWVKPKKPF
tara:strand:+ start:240 stop:410 length:171 start_codon:yes stop_codon:yes gene_type:complete